MQTLRAFIFAISIIAIFSSCEETGPLIDLSDEAVDTTFIVADAEAPQQKNVLLEEFTGVRCVNCPEGHNVIEQLETQHGARFIAISAHSKFLANPYDGDQDLTVQDAQDLEDLLGPIPSKPTAAIDRKIFSGESSLVHYRQKWSSYVNQQLQRSTPVNLKIETDFNVDERTLRITTTAHYTSEVNEAHKLSMTILENEIITAQLGHSGIDSFYTQNHVLRKIVTPITGLSFTPGLEKGRVIIKNYTVDIPDHWHSGNLRIVALVHSSNEVIQCVEKDL